MSLQNEVRIFVNLACMIMFAGVATACSRPENRTIEQPPLATPQQDSSPVADSVSTTQDLVSAVAVSAKVELEASRIAAQGANGGNVREFARTLIAESAGTVRSVNSIAHELGVLTPSTDGAVAATTNGLRQADPHTFDAAYLDAIVGTQQDLIDTLEGYAQSGENAELRAWAQEQLPVLRVRLEEADTLRQSVNLARN